MTDDDIREEEFRPATFYIFDARGMLAAMANMAAGRGTEEVGACAFCCAIYLHLFRLF